MNIKEIILFVILLVLFGVFFGLNVAYKDKPLGNVPIGNIITTAGIGSILAGTFFGVVRPVLLNQQYNPMLIYLIILLFFIWYIITKFASSGISGNEASEVTENKPAIFKQSEMDTEKDKLIAKAKSDTSQGLSGLYKAFISVIIIFVLLMILVSIFQQSSNSGALYIYNILITVTIFLAVMFSYISGSRLTSTSKIEILSFTFAYLIIFGIFAPIFVFNSFSFKSMILSTFIFFSWISITQSIVNFIEYKSQPIERH